MVTHRYRDAVARLRRAIRNALKEEHTPKEVAGSFSIGAFITMLPTLGTGLILFVVIAALSERVSKIALFSSVIVFNPVVKWGVYAASFALGVAILGPVDDLSTSEVSMSAGPDIVARLLLGNLILAVAVTPISYVASYRIALRLPDTHVGEMIEEAVDELVDERPAR